MVPTGLPRRGERHHHVSLTECERLQEVRRVPLLDVFDELTAPDQVERSIRTVRAVLEVVHDVLARDDRVSLCLQAAVDSYHVAPELFEVRGTVTFAAPDVHD